MRDRRKSAALVVATLAATTLGLVPSCTVDLHGGGGGGDAATERAANDTSTRDADAADACAGATGCIVLPFGWRVVAYDGSRAVCPAGFGATSRDLVGDPVAPA